jgi:hypothetical protein
MLFRYADGIEGSEMDEAVMEPMLESQREVVARLQAECKRQDLTGEGEKRLAEALQTQVETLRHLHDLSVNRGLS